MAGIHYLQHFLIWRHELLFHLLKTKSTFKEYFPKYFPEIVTTEEEQIHEHLTENLQQYFPQNTNSPESPNAPVLRSASERENDWLC